MEEKIIIGREQEKWLLNDIALADRSDLVAITGCRRIGMVWIY